TLRMLAQPVLSSFIENSLTVKCLPSGVLPLNNNPSLVEIANFSTATVVDRDGQTPVAFGIMSKCNSKQAYCMIGKVADKYARHSVAVERCEEVEQDKKNAIFKIIESTPGPVDKSLMRPYHAVFDEDDKKFLQVTLADSLIEQTVGTFNMDMEKNITVDVVGAEGANLDIWRDRTGFVVTDSNRFAQITVSKNTLIDTFSTEGSKCTSTVSTINKENMGDVLDFDETVTMYNRSAYLNYLLGNAQVTGFVASYGAGSTAGYALASKDRILAVYAESTETASKLITAIASHSQSDVITFFANLGVNSLVDGLKEKASSFEMVTRLHTRTRNVQVKWSKVTVANIGLSIF
ncbi:hypothetical protein PENTCL1PPCAC_28144, partial [Pristionchus entomophagus]